MATKAVPYTAANVLGRSLRRRREQTSPALVGSPKAGRRRCSGLRRSEVAELAGISERYYTRIEQGRCLPSPTVIEVLVNVLRFGSAERASLLAAVDDELVRLRVEETKHRSAPPSSTTATGAWTGPALTFDLDGRITAINPLARELLCDLISPASEVLRLTTLLSPSHRHPDARSCGLANRVDDVTTLLREAAAVIGGRRLDRLLGSMIRTVDGFAAEWERAGSAAVESGWRTFSDPIEGKFALRRITVVLESGATQLSLAYEAGESQLAERALERIRRRITA